MVSVSAPLVRHVDATAMVNVSAINVTVEYLVADADGMARNPNPVPRFMPNSDPNLLTAAGLDAAPDRQQNLGLSPDAELHDQHRNLPTRMSDSTSLPLGKGDSPVSHLLSGSAAVVEGAQHALERYPHGLSPHVTLLLFLAAVLTLLVAGALMTKKWGRFTVVLGTGLLCLLVMVSLTQKLQSSEPAVT